MTFSTESKIFKFYPYFKWLVYSLLAFNMIIFFTTQSIYEGIDSLAWILLLLLFEYETTQMEKPYISLFEKYAIHLGRAIAYTLIFYATYEYSTDQYITENGFLDMVNALTWLAVVAVIEYDVYMPGLYSRVEWIIRNGLKVVLYFALIVFAIMWGIEGAVLDFLDAFLWIVCFFFIELNIIQFEDEIPYEEELEENEIDK